MSIKPIYNVPGNMQIHNITRFATFESNHKFLRWYLCKEFAAIQQVLLDMQTICGHHDNDSERWLRIVHDDIDNNHIIWESWMVSHRWIEAMHVHLYTVCAWLQCASIRLADRLQFCDGHLVFFANSTRRYVVLRHFCQCTNGAVDHSRRAGRIRADAGFEHRWQESGGD